MYACPEPFDAPAIIRFRRRPTLRAGRFQSYARQVNRIMMTKSPIALIALASSAALAQQPSDGNIPAPDLFDSQILCSGQLPAMPPMPSVVPAGATASQLDSAIGTGNAQIDDQDILDALGYVVPPQGSNCGQGEGEDAFTVADQGSVAVDIAEGYSALLPHFTEVYGDPDNAADSGTAGAVTRARQALERAEADDTTSAARLTVLRAQLTEAQAEDAEARAGFAAISGGTINDAAANPIYAAALAEWMAKSAVTRAIEGYNSAVQSTNRARLAVDVLNYGGNVPLGNDQLVDDVIVDSGGVPQVNLARLREYANATGGTEATMNTDGVYDTSRSNFDAAGNLVAPNRLTDGELEPITQATGVAQIRSGLDERKVALAALKKLQTDNLNALLQPTIDEGVRRAQAEVDHYDQQLRNALTDTTNQNTVTTDNPNTPGNEAAPYSIASRHADFIAASNARVGAEATLRAAAAAREGATQHVIDQFSSPATFYTQLVARREALQAAADKAVADASAGGATPSMALTNAAAAAATALEEAQTVQASYELLVADPDSPVHDLIDTLVQVDGDDGQALVDTLLQTYGRTTENREAVEALTADTEDGADADGPITANRKTIDSLTADTEDGAEADGPVTANRKAIDALTADTDEGAEADGPVTTNRKRIDSLDGRVMTNETNIATLMEDTMENTQMISRNAGAISTNASNISANAGNIVTNASFINQNAANIAHNGARIDVNSYHIAQNSDRIGANAAAIGMNSAAIGVNSGMILDNRQMIGEINGQLDMMRAGVAASIAISRMPSIDGGISFGAGVYGGERAYAVGFALDHRRTTFDIGVTSSGGEIGAGIGVGVKIWGD